MYAEGLGRNEKFTFNINQITGLAYASATYLVRDNKADLHETIAVDV